MPPHATRTLILLALLAWSAPAPAAEPPKAAPQAAPGTAGEVVDFNPESDPPQAAPADLALWREGRQISFDILSCRREASRLQRHARAQRLADRLGEVAKARPHEEGERLAALQARVQASWMESYSTMARPWPVEPTRGCGYPWLTFDSALRAAAAGATRADVVTARNTLRSCIDRATPAVKEMQRSNVAFGAVVAEAEKTLSAVEPPKSAAAAGAAKAAAPKGEGERHEAQREHEARRD
jgi:hypothetical protein